jgi:hypothetical protein
MAACPTCNNTILFGGRKRDGVRYCNARCMATSATADISQSIPPAVLQEAVQRVLAGPCPLCEGTGPVDAFTSHRIASLILVTSWRSEPRISCRGCATRRQIGGLFYSLFFGWWGIPWGFVMTPVQITRNLVGLTRQANPSPRDDALFEALVRQELATRAFVEEQGAGHAA